MRIFSTLVSACRSLFSGHRARRDLTRASSHSLSTSILAKFAAGALICASAGLGATFAWTSGAHHGPVLAALLVLFALGLEICKPLSISYAFDAFRNWRVVQGAALALLGLVAVTYSLTAELSMMTASRGDLVAERTAQADAATKASDRYDRAKIEWLSLPQTQSKFELDEKIAGLLLTPGLDSCKEINGPVTKRLCPELAALKTEAARAERREQLEATMQEAERDTATAPAAKVGDPGAAALSAYLALIGLIVDPKLLSNLLVLVGVVALEAGSALSLVMVRAVSPLTVSQLIPQVKTEVVQPPLPAPVVPVVHAEPKPVSEDTETAREEVKKRVLTHLKTSGGQVAGSQRGLSKLIGADKTTWRRAINSLTVAGIVAMEATRSGTALKLLS